MWETQVTALSKDTICQIRILKDGNVLTWKQVIEYWINDSTFRSYYNLILKHSSFNSYFWEHPSIEESDLSLPYEFVLVKSKWLDHIVADPNPFSIHFKSSIAVAVFPNLGRDAMLIAPVPRDNNVHYSHLGQFVRNARPEEIDQFWKSVGETFSDSLCTEKRWLSTSGLGVHWLHVRIDSIPKYYQYDAYKY